MTPMKWFFSFLKKYRGLMIVGILLTTAVSVLSVVNPYISGQIVDQVISGGKYDRLMPFIGCLIGVTIVMGVLRFLFQVAFETASQGVLYDMRDKVYRKLLEEDFAFYNKKRTGDLMSRQTGDMDAIRHFCGVCGLHGLSECADVCVCATYDSLPSIQNWHLPCLWYCRLLHLQLIVRQKRYVRHSSATVTVFLTQCVCAGKCQWKPCGKSICKRRF